MRGWASSLALLTLALLLPGTGVRAQTLATPAAGDGGGGYTNVDAPGLAAMLQNKSFPLINVHVPYEGEIEGTDRFIPFDKIDAHLAELPADKRARIVLYCQSGRMSAIAAQTLARHGYTDVWNLEGGMVAWARAGYALLVLHVEFGGRRLSPMLP